MTSALALGHAGLRLRSRRVRSGRSSRLSPALLLATLAIASGVGFFAFETILSIQIESQPVVDAASPGPHPQLPASLRSIDVQIQRSVAQEGLLVAAYQNGEMDRTQLQRQLADVLTGYRAAASDAGALDLPPSLQADLQADEAALSALTQSAVELSQAYDDGDQARVTAALARSLAATARLHALSDEVIPH
jgi:hypothetical protein